MRGRLAPSYGEVSHVRAFPGNEKGDERVRAAWVFGSTDARLRGVRGNHRRTLITSRVSRETPSQPGGGLSDGKAAATTLASAGFGAGNERAEEPPMVELTSVKQRRMTT